MTHQAHPITEARSADCQSAVSQVVNLPTLRDPRQLTIHPLIKDLPQWPDNDPTDPRFDAFCRDIEARGFDCALKVNSTDEVIDGRHRLRAARRLKLDFVPVDVVEDAHVAKTVLHYIVQRRHYPKGALAYIAIPLVRDSYVQGTKSMEMVAAEFGFSLPLLKQAFAVRDIFADQNGGAEYRAEIEPDILSGEAGLGAVIAGWAGRQATKGQKKKARAALDLWDRSIAALQNRFKSWTNFDDSGKAIALQKLDRFVAAMPPDLLTEFANKLKIESKRRS